ncbi:MAG: tetratricopeptide repeat protein [Polaribacter sp.]
MKNIQKILFFATIFTIAVSCSTKKDTVISRNYHTLTTKYNVLFNGKELFNKGVEEIAKSYKDNYWKQLPIEPLDFNEEKIAPPKFDSNPFGGFDSSTKEKDKTLTPFDKAEEKAVKAVQKHSMNINGIERNSQIDDAYLLLGKSRYYSQRFVPAIEAFNYIIANYPSANLINETIIWRAKANIRIDNEERAIRSLKFLVKGKNGLERMLPEEIKEQAHAALAMAYVKSDSIHRVKEHLIKATRTLNNREQAARNLFILGQVYSSENKKDSASMVFRKLVAFKKAPYRYQIHANIELAKNFSKDSSSTALIERMQKLIKDRDNRPYLDELYYQVGVLKEDNDSVQTATGYYNKSLRAKQGGDEQKTYTYERLGNLYFKESEYQLASAYYDSVLKVSKDSIDVRIRRVKRKHKNLASLIKYEEVVTVNDSVLRLVALTPNARKIYFQKYIAKLKKRDEEIAQQQLNASAFGGSFGGSSLQSNNKGKWYFYNTQSLGFGKTEFQKVWGNRALADDWRWSNKIAIDADENDAAIAKGKSSRYDLESYLEAIPSDKIAIDNLKTERNQALYELGIIYKEQFKNTQLSIQRLERVLSLQPEEKLILPIHWHLYQIYKNLGNQQKTNIYRNVIITKYPNTKFAQVILFPNKEIKQEEVAVSALENSYKELYYLYKENKFEETVNKIDKILPEIQNSKIISKFELLRGYAIGKYQDKEAYKMAMEFVAVTYASTEEGKKAKDIVEKLNE